MTPIPNFLVQIGKAEVLKDGKENPRTETDPTLEKLTEEEGRGIRTWFVNIEEDRVSIEESQGEREREMKMMLALN